MCVCVCVRACMCVCVAHLVIYFALNVFRVLSFPFRSSGGFGRLIIMMITFANRLDQDQDRQNVGPDLDPNR